MTSAEFSQMTMRLAEELTRELPVINEKAALNAYAMMKNRIINDGTIGENKSLGEYSDNALPSWWFKGKALNKGGEKELIKSLRKENKDGQDPGISYKRWREANNLPTDHKTLSFTGTTLNDVGVTKSITEKDRVITIVGAKNTKNRDNGKTTSDILNYLGDDYGDILAPNQTEQNLTFTFINKEVDKIIKRVIK